MPPPPGGIFCDVIIYIPLLFQPVAKSLYWQNGNTSQSHNVLTYEVYSRFNKFRSRRQRRRLYVIQGAQEQRLGLYWIGYSLQGDKKP